MRSKEYFKSFSNKSSNEFFTSFPENYRKGKHKYVVLLGTVISGLGKGVIGSALASLLQSRGIKTTIMKFDGYLNQDAGTLNPFRHGEVFVLDDGTECDMDLGTYERFFDQNFTHENYLTAGKLFSKILTKERKGGYIGRDVQFIPHVTGEIKHFVRNLAKETDSDITFIEVGGTVGDIENSYFIEAMRELRNEEGEENVSFVALTYILKPKTLREQKSKAAQLGLRSLMALGITPDFIVCRAEEPVTDSVKEKISVYSNVDAENVVSGHDVDTVYALPQLLKDQNFDEKILKRFDFPVNEIKYKWDKFLDNYTEPKNKIKIAIPGKYTSLRDSYASILCALDHCQAEHNVDIQIKWIETTNLENPKKELEDVDAVIVPGGFGKRGFEGKVKCARYCRENNLPYLGLCLGFQAALVDFARSKCNLEGANSTEVNPETKHPVVFILPQKEEQLGGTLRLGGKDVEIKENSLANKIYRNSFARERFRHRYECNPDYIKTFEEKGLVFSGKAPEEDIMQILELPEHKYFVAVQYHPEFTSRPFSPNPLFSGLVRAAID